MRNGSGAISVIAQIAIGNGDLYTRPHARDNIMVSLKIAPPFYGRIVIGKSSAAVVLRGLSPIFIARRLIPAFTTANDGFRWNFHSCGHSWLLSQCKKYTERKEDRGGMLLPVTSSRNNSIRLLYSCFPSYWRSRSRYVKELLSLCNWYIILASLK